MLNIDIIQSIDHILNNRVDKDEDTISILHQTGDKDAYYLSKQIIEYISLKGYKTSIGSFTRVPAIIGIEYDEKKKSFMIGYMY